MASQALFDTVPPFPDDVPTASIPTISLTTLTSSNLQSSQTLIHACQTLGFFLLDLRGDALGETMISEIGSLFAASKHIMDLPQQVRTEYAHDPPRSFLGFKPLGTARTESNEPDRFEWFNISQDSLLGNTAPQPLPDSFNPHLPLFTSFLQHGQTIVSTICTTLATQLNLPADAFTTLQRTDKPSGTVVRLIKAAASPTDEDLRTSMIGHTDFGTITLLANVLGGLQILVPGKVNSESPKSAKEERKQENGDEWLYIRPQPGCLVVNLGDAMVQWTGGVLRSNVHRINFAPGQQRFEDRYSLALLVRPERDASMRRLMGDGDGGSGEDGDVTAWEWEMQKMMALKRV